MSGQIDLAEFERRIVVRPLRIEDFDRLVEIQLACFPGMLPWKREQIDSQLKTFPEGQVCIEYQGTMVASCSSLIVDFTQHSAWHNWKEISDNGYIRNHDPEGDTLYGIEIMVHPDFRGMKLARRLYAERKRIAREHNVERIIIAGRIPGYGRHADEMSAREYVEKVIDKTFVDPVLTVQLSNGFVLKQLIPDYMPGDEASRGYATFLEWTNLDHTPRSQRQLRSVSLTRICVVQYGMRTVGSFEEFAKQCEYFVDVASDYKSDFVVLPELLTTQLLPLVESKRPGLAVRDLSRFTGDYLERFTRLAIKYDVNIVGGSHFVVEDGRLYNMAYLFRRDGTLERQAKLHVNSSEQHWWGVTGGERLGVFETDRGRVAVLVGEDVLSPELSRQAAADGAAILFVPFNTDERSSYLRIRYCAQARCVENDVYVALAGCVGNLPFVQNADIHYAESGIYTPTDIGFPRDGIAGETTPNVEAVLVHDVDLELLKRRRVTRQMRAESE